MAILMRHRHLNHEDFTLAAIDDVIERGKRRDWVELRQAALEDREIMRKVLRVCQARTQDPYAQRYRFWRMYAERCLRGGWRDGEAGGSLCAMSNDANAESQREEAIRKLAAMPEMAGATRETLERVADELLAYASAPDKEEEVQLDSRGCDQFGVNRSRTLGFKDEAVERVRKAAAKPRPWVYDEEAAKRSLAEFIRRQNQAD